MSIDEHIFQILSSLSLKREQIKKMKQFTKKTKPSSELNFNHLTWKKDFNKKLGGGGRRSQEKVKPSKGLINPSPTAAETAAFPSHFTL